MYTSVYIYTYTYMYIYMYIFPKTPTLLCTSVYTYIHIYPDSYDAFCSSFVRYNRVWYAVLTEGVNPPDPPRLDDQMSKSALQGP